MEFGLFVQAHVPRHEAEVDPEGAEHSRLMRELELAEACDRSGWKYVWSVEHHFLEEYSHLSASEVMLPYIAARTKRIHVGSAIYNITPRSEEHTSELQSLRHLVCRLLLEKKKKRSHAIRN